MQKKYYPLVAIMMLVIVLLVLGVGIGLAEEDDTGLPNDIFLPGVVNRSVLGHGAIAGQVLNQNNFPVAGVNITTNRGVSAVTNSNGIYTLVGLPEGTYMVIPTHSEYTFNPPSMSVVVPPAVANVNFITQVDAPEAIVNGGFEDDLGWYLPITEYPAGYSNALAHNGYRSLRTGIVESYNNRYSYSSGRQSVYIPSDATNPTLSFWIYPQSGETRVLSQLPEPTGGRIEHSVLAGDTQMGLILDGYGNWIGTLFSQTSNSRTWTYYEYNLRDFAGETIQIYFGTYNDGANGVTAMYVDDVSLDLYPGGGPTPAPTLPPVTPGPCTGYIDNGGFEAHSDWDIPLTRYSAGYSTEAVHSGAWAMRSGITKVADNTYSYSDFRQTVYIPSSETHVTLRVWERPRSGEAAGAEALPDSSPTGKVWGASPLAGDVQYILILDQYQYWIDTLLWQRSNTNQWVYHEFDLTRYAGRLIYIQFGTYNDGWGGISSMFVDDVSLDNCYVAPTPTITPIPSVTPIPTNTPLPTSTPLPTNTPLPTTPPTITPTPGPCAELVENNGFEFLGDWEIIVTKYLAGYSTAQAHSGLQSMRTGIVNPADNTYSYSDFRQGVYIPTTADDVTLGFWLYPKSGEVLSKPLPPLVMTEEWGEAPLAADLQYVLILDQRDIWIDTLVWMRSNSQTWTYYEFDMTNHNGFDYRGKTIKLQPGTYNDGWSGITSMYVDDVSMQACTNP